MRLQFLIFSPRSLTQHLYSVESEIEETDYDSVEETSSVLSTEEWEDESDSWETDNGLTTEDDSHVNNADATDMVTPNPTPTGSTMFIIPPQDGSKVGVTSPAKGVDGEEGEVPVACPASGGCRSLIVLHLLCIIARVLCFQLPSANFVL